MQHGTAGGYRFYGCKCVSCAQASREDVNQRRQRRRDERSYIDGRWVAPLPDEQHGTRNAYAEYSCRCLPCTKANADDARARYQRRRQQELDERRTRAQQRNRRAQAARGEAP